MNTKHYYSPRPLRETSPHKSAADIQQEINLMRAMYAERRSLNHARHEAMVGWSLVAVGVGLPILIAIAILI
jgi:hypothetical protein